LWSSIGMQLSSCNGMINGMTRSGFFTPVSIHGF
jgi:hypothetical protein